MSVGDDLDTYAHQGEADRARSYNIAAIRALLKDAFTVDTLWRFCQERPLFRLVLERVERNPSLEGMIDVLTEYCRTQDLFSELLSEIRAVNPRQYERYAAQLIGQEESAVERRRSLGSPPARREQAPAQRSGGIAIHVDHGGVFQAGGDITLVGGDSRHTSRDGEKEEIDRA